MSKIRVQNNAAGERGVYIGGDLKFVKAGTAQVFEGATDGEVKALTGNKDLRVQSGTEGDWTDLSTTEVPDARQWLAVAADSKGSGLRKIALDAGEWFVGSAVASDEPGVAGGYSWSKIGAPATANDGEESELQEVRRGAKALIEELHAAKDRIKELEASAAGGSDEFDPATFVDRNAPLVIEDLEKLTDEQRESALEAEKAGKNRKGVIEAIEELQTAPEGDGEQTN